jgi:hypothetical protein
MGKKKIRAVYDIGNGSGRATLPKDLLQQWGLVEESDADDEADQVGGHIVFEYDDDEDSDERGARIAPVE